MPIREVTDFDVAALINERIRPPTTNLSAFCWDLSEIMNARDLQLVGRFKQPCQLAKMMRTDDAMFTAYHNRIAPQSALEVGIEAVSDSRTATRIAKDARKAVRTPRSTLASINGTMANHGVAFGIIEWEPSDDGTLMYATLREWPIEWVRWDTASEIYVTTVKDGFAEVPILHGDGRWIVFSKTQTQPWTQEACVLPGSLVWAAHAFAVRDWNKAAKTHGGAKVLGQLPEGVTLADTDGNQSPEVTQYLDLLTTMVSEETLAGVEPAGANTKFISNASTAWQIFSELTLSREKAAARIYLGTDGMLGSVGGAPGVDISTLFGVAVTKTQGDVDAIERGVDSGLLVPWTAVQHGSSKLAPVLRYLMPDADADAEREQYAKRREAFFVDLEAMKSAGMVLDQEAVNSLAKRYDVEAPTLGATVTNKIELAPTDIAKVVTVDEARASQGLPPFGDTRGQQTINELDAEAEATGEAEGTPPAAADVVEVVEAVEGSEGAPAPPGESAPELGS